MPKYARKIVIQGVTETVPGTDPGSGYVAVVADTGALAAPAGVNTPRNTARNSFSKQKPTLSQRQWNLPVTIELAGGGISGTLQPPAMDWALKGAGMRRTAGNVITLTSGTGVWETGEEVQNTTQASVTVGYVVEGTTTELVVYDLQNSPSASDVLTGVNSSAGGTVSGTPDDAFVYQPWSQRDEIDSVTVHAFVDGIRSVLTYARATAQFTFQHPAKPQAVLNFQGIYSTPTEPGNPAVVYSTVEAPNCFPAVVRVGDVDLTDVAIEGIQYDIGNQVVSRPDIQAADAIIGFEIADRTGQNVTMDPEVATTLAQWNAWDDWTSQKEQVFSTAIGATPGNRIRAVATNGVISEVALNDRNSIMAYGLTAAMSEAPNVDDGEFFLVFS